MKIDYIANVRIPTEKAHGLQIMKMCEAWGTENEVILWAPQRFNYIRKDPFDFYNVNHNFIIRKIFCIDLIPFVNILGRLAFWIQNISFAKLVTLCILFRHQDIIFTRDFWSAYALSLFGKKVTYEIHDSPNKNFITRYAFRKINKFIVTNYFKEHELIKDFGVLQKNILIAQNGVDINFFNTGKTKEECRKITSLPQDKKIVLYSGHLYSWKGAATLLESAKKMDRSDILTVFVGGTNEDVVRFQSKAGFSEDILILGHQEYSKIPYYLGSADVLVLPNTAKERISLYETSPIKLFEYMASGKPIIASKIPSIMETVGNKEVLFFEPDNADDLKEKILIVLDYPQDFINIINGAKELVVNYSWESRAHKILNFIISPLSSRTERSEYLGSY